MSLLLDLREQPWLEEGTTVERGVVRGPKPTVPYPSTCANSPAVLEALKPKSPNPYPKPTAAEISSPSGPCQLQPCHLSAQTEPPAGDKWTRRSSS